MNPQFIVIVSSGAEEPVTSFTLSAIINIDTGGIHAPEDMHKGLQKRRIFYASATTQPFIRIRCEIKQIWRFTG